MEVVPPRSPASQLRAIHTAESALPADLAREAAVTCSPPHGVKAGGGGGAHYESSVPSLTQQPQQHLSWRVAFDATTGRVAVEESES